MTKSQKPLMQMKVQKNKHTNQKEFLVWAMVLTALLLMAAGVLWSVRRAPESHVHIPATAFEKKSTRMRDTNDLASNSTAASSIGASRAHEANTPPSSELQSAIELVDQGHWDQAEPILLAELERNPRNEGVLIELAMIQILDKHEPQLAQPYLESAIRVNPQNDAAVEELLGVYEESQNWEQALRYFESIPDGEGRAIVNYGKGTALLSGGRNNEAVEVLRKSVYDDDYKAFSARESLATAYESTGRWEEASREYEQIISGPYKPEQIRLAKIRLANCLSALKNYAQARAILEPMVEAEPKDKYAARVLEQVYGRERKQ
ncbi:MAG: tetratricopeptide repeat protein [Oligoflexus sp.]|nr:tetratricopeptide repeat protein [Oligoflexus sp.]